MKLVAVLLVFFGATLTASASTQRVVVLSSHGVGAARLGLPRARAMHELTSILGRPSPARVINHACAPKFTEVAWKHLYVEFGHGRMSGYRYMEDGWPPTSSGKKRAPSDLPRLFTSRGITLGSTLAKTRTLYGRLKAVGTNRWATPGGLILYDNATHYPDPASSRIVEIKTANACGDF